LFWMWYKQPLASRVTMWLYWVSLGYVLGEARGCRDLEDAA
jgi:hypothetical protein